jgi:hypothetical protein
MKIILKNYMHKEYFREEIIKLHCVGHFCVNDNKKINVTNLQTMHYILCHNNPILNVNPKTQARKGLIIFNTSNCISTLRKHANLDHSNIF